MNLCHEDDRCDIALDEHFMELALGESYNALPDAIPNPPVGCVLVRNGGVISRGFTHPPEKYHAEAHALSQVYGDLDDVTAYVMLEPCAFHGRTPSCALSLVQRRIKAVVVAVVDPDPRNSGKGIEILQKAGVIVRTGAFTEPVSAFIRPYLNMPANHLPSCTC